VIYDRAWSAIAMAKPGDIDWDKAFEGVEWFHITGITPAISESAMALSLESVQEAKKRGITVSCDLNYRKNLWKYARIRTTTGEAGGCCVFTILSIRRFLPLPRSTGSGMCVSPGRSA
jgi:sugar/nucleoside kinase (ribokinase family)